MSWIAIVIMLALVVLCLVLIGGLPRRLWELTGAALLFGLAGYAWQGSPHLAGEPRTARRSSTAMDEEVIKLRRSFGEYGQAAQWLTISDGLARQGRSKDAANVLVSGLRASPDDPQLWVGLGNALVAHGGGLLSPSAEYSYQHAMRLAPQSSAAPYFYGLALAQSGQYAQAQEIWAELSRRLPDEVPLQELLKANLDRLKRILAAQSAGVPQ